MALDPRYVTSVSLEEYFVNKDLGIPNSFGTIEFWQDDNRVVPKNVYQLTGAPPNYTYTALPNPITLSAVGTPSDANGNNVAIYYFPYDADGNIQLYYVVVRDQNGTVQETREGWPNTTPSDNPVEQESGLFNQLVNPQFAFINFLPNNPLTITNAAGAGTYTYSDVIPGWTITVVYTGNGSIQVQRTAIAGTSQYPGNPPYTITITPGANVSGLTVTQYLTNDPNIFAPAAGGADGYISGSILLAPLSSIQMYYQPNGQASQQILAANNTTGSYVQYDNTIQLTAANNANDGDTGFVSIFLTLPIVGATTFSNVQLVGLSSDIQGVRYNQETVVQQNNQLFNYNQPFLNYKETSSYLVGWDFAYNPAQFLGTNIAASAAGANTSKYFWDQTIIFQSANNGIATNRALSGALTLSATNTAQPAIIQYLPASVAVQIVNNPVSCNIAGITTTPSHTLNGTISLWYSTDANLPNINANQSLIATIDANGKPATFNGNWFEVPRGNLGNAKFTIGNSPTSEWNDYGFHGWDLKGVVPLNTIKWFAIVVGFGSLTTGLSFEIGSVSCVSGNIPTRPNIKSPDEVLRQCQYYYSKSFLPATIPAQAVGANTGDYQTYMTVQGGNNRIIYSSILFPVEMYDAPTLVTYNPVNADNLPYNYTNAGAIPVLLTAGAISPKQFAMLYGSAAGLFDDRIGLHWTADSRLGTP